MSRQTLIRGITIASLGMLAFGATAQSQMDGQRSGDNAADKASSRLYSDYKTAWQSCAAMPPAQQSRCVESVTKQYSALAPKCEKTRGPAYDDCIRNPDRKE